MGSPFAKDHTTTVPLLDDPPHVVTIRKLTGGEFEQAQGAHLAALVAGRPARGWAGRFQAAIAQGIATNRDAAHALTDPLAGFDRLTICRAGIVRWDYPAELPQAVADLDDDTLETLAVAIMTLTKPAWFQSPEAREIAEKELAAAAPGA